MPYEIFRTWRYEILTHAIWHSAGVYKFLCRGRPLVIFTNLAFHFARFCAWGKLTLTLHQKQFRQCFKNSRMTLVQGCLDLALVMPFRLQAHLIWPFHGHCLRKLSSRSTWHLAFWFETLLIPWLSVCFLQDWFRQSDMHLDSDSFATRHVCRRSYNYSESSERKGRLNAHFLVTKCFRRCFTKNEQVLYP